MTMKDSSNFRNVAIALSLASLLGGCATVPPTPYGPRDATGFGYAIIDVPRKHGDMKAALFEGNAETSSNEAFAFSIIAAYEYCSNLGMLTIPSQTIDFSKERTYTDVESYTTTTPGYSTNLDGKTYRDYSKDKTETTVTSTPVTLVYPKYATPFFCAKRLSTVAGSPKLENLSRELVAPIMQDFKGGILVKQVAANTPLHEDDVIVKVDKKRVETTSEFGDAVDARGSDTIKVGVLRKKKVRTVSVPVHDDTAEGRKINQDFIETLCSKLRLEARPAYCPGAPTPAVTTSGTASG